MRVWIVQGSDYDDMPVLKVFATEHAVDAWLLTPEAKIMGETFTMGLKVSEHEVNE